MLRDTEIKRLDRGEEKMRNGSGEVRKCVQGLVKSDEVKGDGRNEKRGWEGGEKGRRGEWKEV